MGKNTFRALQPERPAPPPDYSGTWKGTYTGKYFGNAPCTEIPVSGAVTLTMTKQDATHYSVAETFSGINIIFNTTTCEITQRADANDDDNATVADDGRLHGSDFTAYGNLLSGSWSSATQQFSYQASRG